MRALITGSSGFIGTFLSDELVKNEYEVVRCDLFSSEDTVALDIMNQEMIQSVLEERNPDVIINLAGQANVGLSWREPQLTLQLNTEGLINVLEAVKKVNPKIRVITIGSSDEYGNLREGGNNVTEKTPVKPITPYAITKLAQELFSQLYVNSYALDVCMVRLFNLGGPGQAKGYLISDFASGLAEIEAGIKKSLSVGNLDSARDYTHVKDACRAIRLIVEKGHTGEIYNVCSGKTHKAQEVLDLMMNMINCKVIINKDSHKMRPSDTPVVCGNHEKLTEHTGWKPELDIKRILLDTLEYWRSQVRNN